MGRQIPNSVIGATASVIGHHYYSHSKLDTLFMEGGAPGEPPAGNCESKCASWMFAPPVAGGVEDRGRW
jgi:hypothetical protein